MRLVCFQAEGIALERRATLGFLVVKIKKKKNDIKYLNKRVSNNQNKSDLKKKFTQNCIHAFFLGKLPEEKLYPIRIGLEKH